MGKPFAGQPGGGFGGFGQGQQGGGMGALQGFMRQMQPQGGGFGQRPQPQMAGAPPQNLGGFGQRPPPQMAGAPPQMAGNSGYDTGQLGQFSNLLRNLPQQPGGAPQLGGAQQPQGMDAAMGFLANRQPQQAPEQPMLAPGGDRDFYTRRAPQQQNLDQGYADLMHQQQMSQNPGGFGGLSQLAGAPQQPARPLQRLVSFPPQQLQSMMGAPQQPAGAPQPMVSFPPQQLQSMMGAMRFSDGGAVAEDPRMQAMRAIQQLANRQRGY
jgi:hypothetical protein